MSVTDYETTVRCDACDRIIETNHEDFEVIDEARVCDRCIVCATCGLTRREFDESKRGCFTADEGYPVPAGGDHVWVYGSEL